MALAQLPLNKLADYQRLTESAPSSLVARALIKRDDFFVCEENDDDTREAQASYIDQILGIRVVEIEKQMHQDAYDRDPAGDIHSWGRMVHEGVQSWIGLDPKSLQTPYAELREMLVLLEPTEQTHVVDLGAAYGRIGMVLHQLEPGAHFTGVEYVQQRVDEGSRVLEKLGCHRAELVQSNMFGGDFELPQGNVYFMYDYGSMDHIRWTMGQLETLSLTQHFKVVARGQAVRKLIQYAHPWLCDVYEPIHRDNFSIYSTFQ